jgi:hypothetical protein
MYGRGIIDKISNRVLGTSVNQFLLGKTHAPLYINGKYMPAVYCGAGAQLDTRIRRGDKPLTFSDAEHDLRYALAENDGRVRNADLKMLSVLQSGLQQGKDVKFTILLVYYGIRAKVAAEKLGGLRAF